MDNKTQLDTTKEILDTMHQQWLEHPVTKLVLKAIQIHGESFLDIAVNNCSNVDISSERIRYSVISTRDCGAVLRLIKSSPKILELINTYR